MWTRAELKDNAKKFFKYNYWPMVLVSLIMIFIGGGGGISFNYTVNNPQESDPFGLESTLGSMSNSQAMTFLVTMAIVVLVVWIISAAVGLFVFNPLLIGAQRFFVVSHYQKARLGELGFAFSGSYLNIVKIMFLRSLYTFLWSLLFVIPGIIKTYEYMMIPYILAENPGIDSKEAFAMSKQMMDGNKWKAFVLDLSFYGWIFLSLLTCGILSIFYVNPYYHMTKAELYVALKEITYGGRGQDMYRQNKNQWDNNQWNNDQWNNSQPNNDQWNNNQWNNYQPNNNQWDNNQWNNSQTNSGQWDNNQWNNGQWNNSQPNNDQWNNNQWNNNQQTDDSWNDNTPT